MRAVLVGVMLVLVAGAAGAAEVYKCVENGRTTYSARPCGANAAKMEVGSKEPPEPQPQPAAEVAPPVPQPAAPAPAVPPPAAYAPPARRDPWSAFCSNVELTRVAPYTPQYFVGRYVGNIINLRCVQGQMTLPGWHDRLPNQDNLNAIARSIGGTLVNGSALPGREMAFIDKVDRIKSTRTYAVNICFGESDFEIVGVQCN